MKERAVRLLRWSEKYTKTDMVYLAKGGFWVSIKRILGIIVGISLSIALANLLAPEEFGVYKFVLSLASIIAAFSLTGMSTAVMQAVAKGFEGAVSEGLRENLRWSVGMILLSLGGAGYYFLNENTVLGTSLLIIAATLPLIYSFDLYSPLLKGRKDFKRETFYSLPRLLLPPLFLIGTVFYTQNPIVLIAVYFVSQALVVVISYFIARHKEHINTEKPDTLAFSRHLSVMNILEILASNIDKILLFHYLGAAQLAIYALAIAPIRELRKLKSFFLTPAFPKLSNRSLAELKHSLPPRMLLLFLILLPFVGAYILAAPYIYQYIFPQYLDSIHFSQTLAVTLLFIPISILPQALTAHLKKRQLYILRTATPLARIVLITVLLPLYGIWGIVGAIFCVYVFNAVLTLMLFKRAV
ncbi:oligosaccharide flippase family protein [Candidatus Kaiserbacteria bacterium]|nr:oligosaccharide flippase family protein [Candidatus Kaiserbacteria bacterium]